MNAPDTQTSPLTASGRAEARVAISGASGFLGRSLVEELERSGATVHRLVRRAPRRPTDILWNPAAATVEEHALEGMDVVVNLAGEPVAQRWTRASRARIRASRVRGTATIANAVLSLRHPPRVLLSGSAVGIYGGDRADEMLDERSAPGSDFLSEVGMEWEAAAEPVRDAGVRLVLLRTGVVLGTHGGILDRMLLPFRLGLGGRFASGHQWMSWIALADWVAAVRFAVADQGLEGPVNLVAPNPVTNAEFTRVLGRVLRRPTIFPVPAFALRILFNEMADVVLAGGQRVRPAVLEARGFRFRHPSLAPALDEILRR